MSGSFPRVVVTGMGVVSPLGVGIRTHWQRLLDGYCGIVKLNDTAYDPVPCKIAARVPSNELDLSSYRQSELKSMSLATIYSLVASQEALDQSRLGSDFDSGRVGVSIGNGMSGLTETCEMYDQTKLKGIYRAMSPHYITRILPNMSSGQVSIRHKFTGPNLCNSTACAAGVQAIGDGYNMIRLNHADVMVCGSTEATINPMTMSGFSKMRALTTKFNDDPVRASRPFDRLRDGFVLGEGCGIVVLERLEHAQRRNAEIVGEILGYGLSSDGSHITQPSGQGAVQSMKQALNMAQLKPEDIGYINAHATSTPIGDRIERQAISEIFHELNPDVYVSSTKGSTGHLLGGAGSVETIFTILACLNKRCPPTLNYNQADDENDKLNISSKISDSWTSERRIALKNSFGFGGTNSTIIVGNYL